MVRMHVHKVGLDPQRRPLVLLADDEAKRVLPIWIGPFEAHAISFQLQAADFPRPLTHDLLLSVMAGLGGRLLEVHVTKLENDTFFALLMVEGPGGRLEIDSRPSDAIALALRAGVDIFVAEPVLEERQLLSEDGEADEIAKLRGLLGGLQATDLDAANEEPEG